MSAKVKEAGRIVLNEEIAPGIFWMSTIAPKISAMAAPGQFVHVCVPENPVQLLRMPFAVYDASAALSNVDICYQVVGEGTEQLSHL